MRNLNAIICLFFAIGILVAVDLVLGRWGRVSESGGRSTLLDPDWKVSGIRIERRGSPAVALVRDESWKIVKPFVGAADERSVARLVDALAFTPIADVITDSRLLKIGRTRADFSLVEPVLKVELSTPDRAIRMSFGTLTPTGDGVYVAIKEKDAVFVVPTEVFSAVDVKADFFRWRSVLPVGNESVVSFGIRHGAGQAILFSKSGDEWMIGDKRASKSKISEFLSALSSATATDFLWPVGVTNEAGLASAALLAGYGLDAENAVVVAVKGSDGVDRQVSFGKSAGEQLVYALIQNDSAIVTVPAPLRDVAIEGQSRFSDARAFPVEASSVSVFSIADGDTTYALSREEESGWRLESPIVAPADGKTTEALLNFLLALPSSAVADKGFLVSVSTNGSPVTIARDRVLAVVKFEDLRSKEILSADPETVRRLVLVGNKKGEKPTAVVYERDRRLWHVESAEEGVRIREAGVKSVLDALFPLLAVRVEKIKASAADLDDYGLDRPFLTIAVDQDREGAVRRNLLIGGPAGKGGRYATIGSADAIFVISEKSVRQISEPIVER